MNVVDSSAWLEYFTDGPNATTFSSAIEKVKELVVPTISIFEVFKKVLKDRGEDLALQIVAAMQQGTIVELDLSIALAGAKLSSELRLPMADSIMLATAQQFQAILWTQDADFRGIVGVKYFERTK